MKKFWNEIKDYVYIVVIVLTIRTFFVTPAIVDGESMNNTLEDGQLVIINKINYRFNDIKRFDIVVVDNEKTDDYIIKRVIALPGEKIKHTITTDEDGNRRGQLYINDTLIEEEFLDEEAKVNTCIRTYGQIEITESSEICKDGLTLPDGYYFVMGDNRGNSSDSRKYGVFKKSDVIGRVKYRLFPFSKFGKIK